ncbi:unknown [Crocosphaera subtropica ATCC 51142]|uniref:Ycf66-like protein n=1 Tax=Crocosphaera subtropica (strain ATCC 51142 / BH68) TaxID=43989 RepID=B1WR30_CROS5|nr:Ycf66 family protein [Crocosphaera subtropica]ACB50088.1 unknown [Crocosphaera subtropica ATCC 51142]
MVNFGLNSASVLGIFLAVAGAGLYFLRTVRPELSRDHDIFFAAVGLLCGLILLFQGWRLDPILQFGQFLLTGSAVFFAVESIRLRGATTEQAKRSSSFVDDDRRVSKTRVYTEAELDRLEPYEEEEPTYRNNPRLQGYADPRSSRGYGDDDPRTPRSRRRPPSDPYSDRPSPRRTTRPSRSTTENYDAWGSEDDMWEDRPKKRRPSRPRPESSSPQTPSSPPRKRRPRPSSQTKGYPSSPEETPTTTDYVDYQPIDPSESPRKRGSRPSNPEDNYEGDRPSDPSNFDY